MEPENKADESNTMRSGTLEDWRGANDVGAKPASAPLDGTTNEALNTELPSNETEGTQQRGTREDWWRTAEPDSA
ncbi:MAG: hypothetical protein ACRD2L_20260, partial [Terriglobia bacterium]